MRLPERVYHLTEASNWESIQGLGLLCAAELIARSGLDPTQRRVLELAQRGAHTALPSGVSIRDQKPMPARALATCLVGLTPEDWYATINSRVFFWLDPERMNRQRAACERRPQVVMVVDAARLVAAYAHQAALSPINTGNARRRPARRGSATFVPYSTWLESGWATEAQALGTAARQDTHEPVELTIKGSVPDIMEFVIRTKALAAGKSF